MHKKPNTLGSGVGSGVGSGDDFQRLHHIKAWRPSLLCDQDHLNKLSFPQRKNYPYELAQWF